MAQTATKARWRKVRRCISHRSADAPVMGWSPLPETASMCQSGGSDKHLIAGGLVGVGLKPLVHQPPSHTCNVNPLPQRLFSHPSDPISPRCPARYARSKASPKAADAVSQAAFRTKSFGPSSAWYWVLRNAGRTRELHAVPRMFSQARRMLFAIPGVEAVFHLRQHIGFDAGLIDDRVHHAGLKIAAVTIHTGGDLIDGPADEVGAWRNMKTCICASVRSKTSVLFASGQLPQKPAPVSFRTVRSLRSIAMQSGTRRGSCGDTRIV